VGGGDLGALLRLVERLESENAALRSHLTELEGTLGAIQGSKAWRVITAYRKLRGNVLDRVTAAAVRRILASPAGDAVRRLARRPARRASRAGSLPQAAASAAPTAATGRVHLLTSAFFNGDGNDMFSGGGERYLVDLAELIRERGYEVRVFQPGNFAWRRPYGELVVEGRPPGNDPARFAQNICRDAPPADLTIYHAFFLASGGAPPGAIGICHGNYWDNPEIQKVRVHFRAKVREIEAAVGHLDRLVCVDTNTINWLRAWRHALAARTVYIPNYVDVEQFRPVPRAPRRELVVLYPRRLYPPRGFQLVRNIVPVLLARRPELEFHFVGKAEPEAARSVERLAALYPGRVRWYHLSPEDMHRAYQEADLVLIPTVSSEGTSLSCLEAMASGKAVIATTVGGLPNLVIDGHNGLLIPPDEAALVQAIERVADDEGLRRRLGETARRTVEDAFSKRRWQAQWAALLADRLPPRPRWPAALTVVYPRTPGIRWTTMRQRPQHLCEGLARAGVQVYFCSDAEEAGPRAFLEHRLQILRPGDELYCRGAVVYVHYPYHFEGLGAHPGAVVWYDVLDDPAIFAEADQTAPPERRAAHYHGRLLEVARVVTCSARRLVEAIRPARPDVLYVPNGVTVADFAVPAGELARPPRDLAPALGGGPVVGYYGAYGEWFDFDLVNTITARCPEYRFVFIGPDYRGGVQARLVRRSNVLYLGEKPYAVLKHYLRWFDVGILPFVVNDVTHATSPLKLFEYLAGGKPVVTTDLEEARQYRGVFASASVDAFIDNLERAIRRGREPGFVLEARAEATRNSWEARVATVLAVLRQVTREPQGSPTG
jgi:glycosyltransferase involved in cell wall biosynthesis